MKRQLGIPDHILVLWNYVFIYDGVYLIKSALNRVQFQARLKSCEYFKCRMMFRSYRKRNKFLQNLPRKTWNTDILKVTFYMEM
jgi:hypothetical protein